MVLITSIAKPKRLDRYLPKEVVSKIYLADHSFFDKKLFEDSLKKYNATSILVTTKDLVKINFDINLSVMELDIEFLKGDLTKKVNQLKF